MKLESLDKKLIKVVLKISKGGNESISFNQVIKELKITDVQQKEIVKRWWQDYFFINTQWGIEDYDKLVYLEVNKLIYLNDNKVKENTLKYTKLAFWIIVITLIVSVITLIVSFIDLFIR